MLSTPLACSACSGCVFHHSWWHSGCAQFTVHSLCSCNGQASGSMLLFYFPLFSPHNHHVMYSALSRAELAQLRAHVLELHLLNITDPTKYSSGPGHCCIVLHHAPRKPRNNPNNSCINEQQACNAKCTTSKTALARGNQEATSSAATRIIESSWYCWIQPQAYNLQSCPDFWPGQPYIRPQQCRRGSTRLNKAISC